MKINPDLEIVHQFEDFPTIPPIARKDRVGGVTSGGDIEVDAETGKVTILSGGSSDNLYKLDSQNLSSTDFSVKYSTPNSYVKEEFTKKSLYGIGADDDDGKAKWRIIMNDIPDFTVDDVYKGLIELTNTNLSLKIKTGGADFSGFDINSERIYAMGNMEVSNDVSATNVRAQSELTAENLIVSNSSNFNGMVYIKNGGDFYGTSTFFGSTTFRSSFNILGGVTGQYLRKTSSGTEWASSPTGVSTDVENTWTANQKIEKGKSLVFPMSESTLDDIHIKYHKNTLNYTGYDGLTIFNSSALRLYLNNGENSDFTWMQTGGRFSYSTGSGGQFKRSFSFPDQEGLDGQFLRYNFSKKRSEWTTITPGTWDGGDVKNTTNFNGYVDFNNIVDFNSDARRSTIASPSSLDLMNLSMANTAIDKKITTHNADTSAHPNKITNPSSGSAGQFLQKTSSGVTWADVSGGGGSWNGGIVSGDSTFNGSARFNNRISRPAIPMTSAFSDEIINYQMTGEFIDNKLSTHNTSSLAHSSLFNSKITTPSGGSVGQFLQKTSSSTQWSSFSWDGGIVNSRTTFNATVEFNSGTTRSSVASPTSLDIMNYNMTQSTINSMVSAHDSSGSAHGTLFDKKLDKPSSGSTGQYLRKTSAGTEWADVSGGGGGSWNGGDVDNPATFKDDVTFNASFNVDQNAYFQGFSEFNGDVTINKTLPSPYPNTAMNFEMTQVEIENHNKYSGAHSDLFSEKITNPPNGGTGQVLTLDSEMMPSWQDSQGGGGVTDLTNVSSSVVKITSDSSIEIKDKTSVGFHVSSLSETLLDGKTLKLRSFENNSEKGSIDIDIDGNIACLSNQYKIASRDKISIGTTTQEALFVGSNGAVSLSGSSLSFSSGNITKTLEELIASSGGGITEEEVDAKISTHNSSNVAHSSLFSGKLDTPSGGANGQVLTKTSSGSQWANIPTPTWNGGTVTGNCIFNGSSTFNGSAKRTTVLTPVNDDLMNLSMTKSEINTLISTHNLAPSSHSAEFLKKLDKPSGGSTGQVLTIANEDQNLEWKYIPQNDWDGGIVNNQTTFNGSLIVNSSILLDGGASISSSQGGITFTGGLPTRKFNFVSGELIAPKISCTESFKLSYNNSALNIGKVLTCSTSDGLGEWKSIEWQGGTVINKAVFTNNVDVFNDLGEKNLFNIYDIEKNKIKDVNTLGKYISNGKRIEIIGGYVADGVSPLRFGYSDNPNSLDNVINSTWHSSWMNDALAVPNIDMLFKMWDTRNDYITKAFYKMAPAYFKPWNIPANKAYIPNVSGYVYIRQLGGGDADLTIAGRLVALIRPNEWEVFILPMRDVDTLYCAIRAGSVELLYIPCIFQD